MKIIVLMTPLLITTLFSLEINYEERIPYIQKNNGSINGLVATPALNALKRSGIVYTLKEKPSKRHLHEIKSNQKAICALGWFKSSQRETFAKFSKVLYQDQPMGIVIRQQEKPIFENKKLEYILKIPKRLLTKASYSYGNLVDNKIKEYKTHTTEVYTDNQKMLELIVKKRADYMFMAYEEASVLLVQSKYESLEFIPVYDMPQGNKRYMMCSQKVDDEILNIINEYIE